MKRIKLLFGCVAISCLHLVYGIALMAQEDLVAEMTGSYNTGTEFNLWVATRSGAVRVDYGNGVQTELTVSTDPSLPTKINSYTTEGKSIKVYGRDLTALRCFWNKLTTLTLHAPELEVLHCHTNQIASLDLTDSPKLRVLDATDAGLTNLQIGGLYLLDTLVCDGNRLSHLDLNGMTRLKLLECYNNQLSQLDLTSCSALVKVSTHKNQLTKLCLSGLTQLESVSCWRNQIAEVDLSSANLLKVLDCSENRLTKLVVNSSAPIRKIELYDNQLTESSFGRFVESLPDLSGQESGVLKAIKTSTGSPEGNQVSPKTLREARSKNWRVYKGYEEILAPAPRATLTTGGKTQWAITVQLVDGWQEGELWIDWNNDGVCQDNERGLPPVKHPVEAKTITIHGDLEGLFCPESVLTGIDISELSSLKRLSIGDNKLTQIDLSQNPLIEDLWIQNNQLTTLNLSSLPSLKTLNASGNKITDVIFAPQSLINRLDLASNKLRTIDLSNTPDLVLLNCSNNELTSFDCTPVSGLSSLNLANNQIETINPNELPELIDLNLNDNRLSSINLEGLGWMTKLLLAGNRLSSIDLTGCPAMVQLNLSGNPLTSLDLTPCPNLSWLNLSSCDLNTVDLASLSSLSQLYLSYNGLSQLVLPKKCEGLVALDIEGNKIRGEHMQALIQQLPVAKSGQGEFYVVAKDSLCGNAISVEQVDLIKQKSWRVFQRVLPDSKYSEFEGYTIHSLSLNVGEHGTASIVNYQPYNQVPRGIKLQLAVTPDEGYVVQSITVNGQPLEGRSFEVLKDTEVQILFQKGNALLEPERPSVTFYPNPVDAYLYIRSLIPYVEIALYSSSGAEILSNIIDSTGIRRLELADLPRGVYYLQVNHQVFPIVVTH